MTDGNGSGDASQLHGATQVSRNVIDRRGAATHGAAWLVGLLLGMLGWHLAAPGKGDDDLVQLVSASLDRGQEFWQQRAAESGRRWRDARVVLFSVTEQTPCSEASTRTGPFYCPPNERIYLDVAFLRAIRGDAARAYVVAHELGHHVARVMDYRTADQVTGELLADCLAGDWLRSEHDAGRITMDSIDDVLAEAQSVGDDRMCGGCSVETWTHGSGDQRRDAVLRGMRGEGCYP